MPYCKRLKADTPTIMMQIHAIWPRPRRSRKTMYAKIAANGAICDATTAVTGTLNSAPTEYRVIPPTSHMPVKTRIGIILTGTLSFPWSARGNMISRIPVNRAGIRTHAIGSSPLSVPMANSEMPNTTEPHVAKRTARTGCSRGLVPGLVISPR